MITIILTVYNRIEFYRQALGSLANQNDLDFELLIYSNIDIEYNLQKFRQVDTIYPEKPEMAYWLSDALKRAKYDKIAFLDDDDTFETNKVAILNTSDFQYWHNEYNHMTPGSHIHGNGFNMSCIAINRKYFPDLPSELEKHADLGSMPDTFIYWYALGHNIQPTISNEKLTNYRFRDYQTLQTNAVANMKIQIDKLTLFEQYFKSKKVHKIIRQRLIQDSIYLASFGGVLDISFLDFLWLLLQKNVDNRLSLTVSYFLTLPVLRGRGLNLINEMRKRKEAGK